MTRSILLQLGRYYSFAARSRVQLHAVDPFRLSSLVVSRCLLLEKSQRLGSVGFNHSS